MPGERFSHLYVQPTDVVQDSSRARYRVAALLRESIFNEHGERLAMFISREVGLPIGGSGRYSSHWSQFICDSRPLDFLDTITLIYRYLFWHVGEEIAHSWRDAVKRIFSDEHLSYAVDNVCGIHPAVDPEFQRNMVATVAALQSNRYQNIRQLIETTLAHLNADPRNYRQAWRATLVAVEGLLDLLFPYARLTADEVEHRLLPLVQVAYEEDVMAQRAARTMLSGFRQWLEASHIYRHQPGVADAPQPPSDIAILAISQGASLLRWLVGIDEHRRNDHAVVENRI
jgi:hypothetical protein